MSLNVRQCVSPAPFSVGNPQGGAGETHCPTLTRRCFAGLEELAVPIRVNGRLAAILSCGQFFCGKRTQADFQKTLRQLRLADIRLHPASARRAYFQTTVVSRAALRAVEPLLQVLAQHVQGVAGHWPLPGNGDELPCVARARAFVASHLAEGPKTHDAARAAHVTLQYFCRAFKAATGMTFSEYVARCRVDQARQLLENPARHITAAAFAAGFQSIPHFNHTFKRYTGLSPTAWRASLRP
jgi:AraC-like DNA-binding protein